ncbi:MAG: hypothetical protein ACJAUU_000029 [Rickettsiales bacterium]|jgi:hypothetical protein
MTKKTKFIYVIIVGTWYYIRYEDIFNLWAQNTPKGRISIMKIFVTILYTKKALRTFRL